MTKEHFFADYARVATWTLWDTACLICYEDPRSTTEEASPTSCSLVNNVHSWLLKEHGRDRIFSPYPDEAVPRFSPGTLLRHLEEKSVFQVPKALWDAYNSRSKPRNPHTKSANVKKLYRRAAELIWEVHPSMTVVRVADELHRLHSHMKKLGYDLPRKSPATIKNYLKGTGSKKVGRPAKHTQEGLQVDLWAVAETLSCEIGPN